MKAVFITTRDRKKIADLAYTSVDGATDLSTPDRSRRPSLRRPHIARVTLFIKDAEELDSGHIAALGPVRTVAHPNISAHAIKQVRFAVGRCSLSRNAAIVCAGHSR